jgi:membrane-bound lytic murein transglycosylase D
MKSSLRLTLVGSAVLISACSSFKTKSNGELLTPEKAALIESTRTDIDEKEVSSEDVERNIEKPYKSRYGEINLDDNQAVQRWVNYFQGRGRGYMEQYLSRSTRYLPMMKNVLRENGLPEDLVYIALIESGFSPRAHSRANAVGYWQFIRSTGKRFGLQIDTFIDERRDPVLSTKAAAEYFKALYGLFGDWHLAMASYNVGESRVKRAVNRHYTKDFWVLIKKRRSFPPETKQYVPKFIAAVMIAKDPAKYGFKEIEYQDPLSYDAVTLQSPISLSKLASNISVDLDELKLLNPKFRTDFVPISRGSETTVRIPVGRATDALAALSMSVTTQPKILVAEHSYYRIRRGDTLSTVARKHRTTVSQLRRLNSLSNRTVLRVGHSLKVPDNGGDGIQLVTEEDTRAPAAGSGSVAASGPVRAVQTSSASEYYKVRRGDNLTTISQKYNISIEELRRLNQMSNRTVLRRGQKLRVREAALRSPIRSASRESARRTDIGGDDRVAKTPASLGQFGRVKTSEMLLNKEQRVGAQAERSRRHVVRRGETLMAVSRRYNVTLSDLAKLNRFKINHRVMAGERLVIPD